MAAMPTRAVVWRDPVIRFFLVAGLLYFGWYLLYGQVLKPGGAADRVLIGNLVEVSGAILRLAGHELIPEPANAEGLRTIGIQGGHLLWIGNACNGLGLFAVYLIFLIAYPGPWRHKLWFGAVGLLGIHLINALRIAVLCVVVKYDYEWLNFNHDYTFYVVVYGFVFLLWAIWVKRFAGRHRPLPAK